MFGLKRKRYVTVGQGPNVEGESGFGAPLHIEFSQRPIFSAGAASIAYETLILPLTTGIGSGVQNREQFEVCAPAFVQVQGVGQQSLTYNGINAGTFASPGPLVSPSPGPV